MTELSIPSPELVECLNKELEFDQRLMGLRMTPMGGGSEYSIFSFKDACNFLYMDDEEDAGPGGNESIHYIDFALLQRWLKEVFSDVELAEAIGEEVAKEEYYGTQLPLVKELMMQRLNQCSELA